SEQFRESLERKLSETECVRVVTVAVGKLVPLGEKWCGKIREVIKRAKVVIADVTALSPEVLFEVGFAHGLGRPTLPVVSEQSWVGRLPRWLTELQIGHFDSPEGWDNIVNAIDDAVNGRGGRWSLGWVIRATNLP
ncbi:MAG: nucleoside 2-deoxyribosyltransferase, partial [Nitrososphaera sp.]|nr:nucleoside 2-deoxyribosyltransferase [Nitrososphaera sp.]